MTDFRTFVGAVSRHINPPLGLEMAGYVMPRVAESVLDEIRASAIAIVLSGRTVVLVGVDVLALDADSVAAIRSSIQKLAGVPPEHVMIFASHTHTGPATVEIFNTSPNKSWLDVFERQVASVGVEAVQSVKPAALRIGTGSESALMFNRRTLNAAGRAQMTLDRECVPADLTVEGPIDPSVNVLSARAPDGHPFAVLVNYGNHLDIPTGARYSSDYPGVLSRVLNELLGARIVTVFGNGACGNVEHIDSLDLDAMSTRQRYHDSEGVEKMTRLGTLLAAEVYRVLGADASLDIGEAIGVDQRTLRLQTRTVDPSTVAWAHRVNTLMDPPLHDKTFANETLRVHALAGTEVSVEIQAFALGDVAILGIPAEVFVELGLEIKQRSPFRCTLIIELANGWVGYLPTLQAFTAGGYEVRTARSSRLQPDAATRVVEAATDMLTALYSRNDSPRSGT